MRKPVFVAAIAAMLLGGVALAQRPERGPEPGRRPRPRMGSLKQELGLSDAQEGQLRALRSEHRKAAVRRRADLKIARIELEELMNAPTVDEKALAAKIKQISDLQAAALKDRVDRRLALRKVLTPEQLEKMRQMRPERGRRHPGMHRGHMPPPPGGPGPGDDLPEPDDQDPGQR